MRCKQSFQCQHVSIIISATVCLSKSLKLICTFGKETFVDREKGCSIISTSTCEPCRRRPGVFSIFQTCMKTLAHRGVDCQLDFVVFQHWGRIFFQTYFNFLKSENRRICGTRSFLLDSVSLKKKTQSCQTTNNKCEPGSGWKHSSTLMCPSFNLLYFSKLL